MLPKDFSSVPVWFPGGSSSRVGGRGFAIRIPKRITVKYELDGNASVVVSEEGIMLKHETSGTVVWRNLQIGPRVWP